MFKRQDLSSPKQWLPLIGAIGVVLLAFAGQSAFAQQIFSCVDGRGRVITADRPIPECIDREQRLLNPSGTTKARVEKSLTADERAAKEEQEKAVAAEAARIAEDKRRDRALITRYPTRAVHDRERAEALGQIDQVIAAADKRKGELAQERKVIDSEMEFYKKDPSKIPPSIRRQVEDNEASIAVQNRFIGDQLNEKKRVNARFDEELVKLISLWAIRGQPTR